MDMLFIKSIFNKNPLKILIIMFMGLPAEIRGRKKILSFVLLLQTISKWPNLPFICHLYLLHLVSLVSDLDSLGFCYIQPPIMQSSLTNLMVYKPRPWGIPGCQIPFQMCFLLKRTILEDIKGKHSPVTSKCKKKKKRFINHQFHRELPQITFPPRLTASIVGAPFAHTRMRK